MRERHTTKNGVPPGTPFLRVVALLALVAGCSVTQVSANEVTTAPPGEPVLSLRACQSVVDELLDDVHRRFGVHTTDGIGVSCVPHDAMRNPDVAGVTYTDAALVVYGGPSRNDAAYIRQVAAHELGHAWAGRHFDANDRQVFMVGRGFTGTPDPLTWASSGAGEDYADTFADWLDAWEPTDGRAWRTNDAEGRPSRALERELAARWVLPRRASPRS